MARPENTIVGHIQNGFLARMMNYSPAAVVVWAALANRSDEHGYSYPSLGLLEEDTGLSRPTVLRALAELEQAGEIRIKRAERRGEGSNKYTIPTSKINLLVKTIPETEKDLTPPSKIILGNRKRFNPNQTQEPDSENQTQEHTHTGVCDSSASRSKAEPRVRQRLDPVDLAAAIKSHQPGRIERSLLDAISPPISRNGETNAEWETKLWRGGDHLNGDKFDRLPACTRQWIDDCLDASRNGLERPSLAGAEAAAKRSEATAQEADRLEDEQLATHEKQWSEDRKKSILDGFHHFGVTRLAEKLYREQGPDRCEQALDECARYEERSGLTTAIKVCKDFAANPEEYEFKSDSSSDDEDWDNNDETYVPKQFRNQA